MRMINILLLNGLSGVGKSTIARILKEKDPERYEIIRSYTTRKRRNVTDNDHIFISKPEIIRKMLNKKFVASTIIDNEIYCAFESQFKKDKINIYIVDDKGLLDVNNYFSKRKDVKIITMRILRDDLKNTASSLRKSRYSHFIPNSCKSIDSVIHNNENLYDTIEIIENLLIQ